MPIKTRKAIFSYNVPIFSYVFPLHFSPARGHVVRRISNVFDLRPLLRLHEVRFLDGPDMRAFSLEFGVYRARSSGSLCFVLEFGVYRAQKRGL